MLRALARHAFAIGDESAEAVAQRFEQWSKHVLLLAPPPGEAGATSESPRRDWRALARFVDQHRRAERLHVETTAASMRDTVLTILQSFRVVTTGQTSTDAQIRDQLDRLESAASASSLEELRTSAHAVAGAIAGALREQELRVEAQARELRGRLATLQRELDEAQRAGETDPLTQLANRRVFDGFVERAALFASVTGGPLSVVLFDVDHFKSVNDRHGHAGGDAVLRAVADTLVRAFPRRSDIVVRYGGEEFAVALLETGARDAQRLAQRFLDALRVTTTQHGGRSINVTASAGVAELVAGESVADLVQRADEALYEAKGAGRDRVRAARARLSRAA